MEKVYSEPNLVSFKGISQNFIIIKTFKRSCKHPEAIFWEAQRNFDIPVDRPVLELLIKTCKILSWSITQEPLVLIKNCDDISQFAKQFVSQMSIIFR